MLPGQTPEQATAKQRRDSGKLLGHEVSLEEFRQGNGIRGYPQGFIGRARESMAAHVEAMVGFQDAGAEVFDYGNSIRGEAQLAGYEAAQQVAAERDVRIPMTEA